MLEQDAFRVSSEDPERGAIFVFGIMSLYKAMTSSGGPGEGGGGSRGKRATYRFLYLDPNRTRISACAFNQVRIYEISFHRFMSESFHEFLQHLHQEKPHVLTEV